MSQAFLLHYRIKKFLFYKLTFSKIDVCGLQLIGIQHMWIHRCVPATVLFHHPHVLPGAAAAPNPGTTGPFCVMLVWLLQKMTQMGLPHENGFLPPRDALEQNACARVGRRQAFLFYCQVVLHCMDVPRWVYPFIAEGPLGCFISYGYG